MIAILSFLYNKKKKIKKKLKKKKKNLPLIGIFIFMFVIGSIILMKHPSSLVPLTYFSFQSNSLLSFIIL